MHKRLNDQVPDRGTREQLAQVARFQAQLASDPTDGVSAQEASEVLSTLTDYDHALRVAGAVAALDPPSPTRWRAYVAMSDTHNVRATSLKGVKGKEDLLQMERDRALQYMRQAIADCTAEESAATCPPNDAAHLQREVEDLEAHASGKPTKKHTITTIR